MQQVTPLCVTQLSAVFTILWIGLGMLIFHLMDLAGVQFYLNLVVSVMFSCLFLLLSFATVCQRYKRPQAPPIDIEDNSYVNI